MTFVKGLSFARLSMLAALAAASAAGQSYNFDNSGNATLKGGYFVREVMLLNVDTQGGVGKAIGVTGVATFDGAGKYNFNGRLIDSTSGSGGKNTTLNGTYSVAANGFLRMDGLAGAVAYGGVGSAGPAAFTASATEESGQVFDLIVGIPMGSGATNASLRGAYNAVYLNFPTAAIGQTRQASMPLQADGAGKFGAVTATGTATDNTALTSQNIPSVTYSLSGSTGTINFGAAAANQLIGGTQSFFVSTDGSLLVGGSPDGFDFLLASPAVPSASNASFQGFYYLGALETDNSAVASQSKSLPDAFYGAVNSTGQGSYTSHLRLNTNGFAVEDLTSGWFSDVQPDGSFKPGDGLQYWLGAGGRVVLGTGQADFYSALVGLHAVDYKPASAGDVFLHPLGIVNAASFAPATNPVAPYEMLSLYGSNLSAGTVNASALPLPTTLGNTRVLVNGIAAPLLSVSPGRITILVPGSVTPDTTAYAAFQVENNGANSKPVTMYTNYTAPGIFSFSQDGFGPAAALDVKYKAIGANNPAKPGDVVALFTTGMGTVTPSLADGAASAPNGQPLNFLDIFQASTLSVYLDGQSANVPFAGVAPGFTAGLDQINFAIPSGVSNGDGALDVFTPEAEAEQVTLNISGASGGAAPSSRGKAIKTMSGRGRQVARRGVAGAPRPAPVSR